MSCVFPFKGIFVESTMDVKFCCAGRYYLGNLKDNTLEEILTGDKANQIRDYIKEGKVHEYCEPCHGLEKMGGNSQRTPIPHRDQPIYFNENYNPDRIDIRWSNTCNLACNYCLPHFSSRWADVLSIEIKSPKTEVYDKIFSFIEKYKESIHNIMLLGGEPLLLKQNQQLLDILTDKNYCVITNLSSPLLKNRVAEKLLNEKTVSWGISFENVRDRFEYVRDGATWDIFYNNLRYLAENKKTIHFYPLYCIYSAFNLVEYYELVNELDIKNITWQLLVSNPLRVDTLPTKLVDKAIREIETIESQFNNNPGLNDLRNIKENLINNTENKITNKDFISWTNTLENVQFKKKKQFSELWPSLFHDLNNE